METPQDLSRLNTVDEVQLMRALLWVERMEQNTPGLLPDMGKWLTAADIQLELRESIYQGLAPGFLTGMSLLEILATAGDEDEVGGNADEDWSDDEFEDDEEGDDDDDDEFEDDIDDEDWDEEEDDLEDEDDDEDWEDDDDEDDDDAPFADDEDDNMPIDKELL